MALPILGAVMGAMGSAAGGVATAGVRGAIGQAAGSVAKSAQDKAVRDGIIKGPKSMRVTAQKSLQKLTGIQFSAGAVAKQSQLLAGIAGSLFQILGAFVDIVLMPLMPVFAKLLVWMASGIPKLLNLMNTVTGYFKDVWDKSNGIMEFLGRLMGDLISNLITWAVGFLWSLLKWVINPMNWLKLVGNIAELVGKTFRGIFNFYWGLYSEYFEAFFGWTKPFFDMIWSWARSAWEWLSQFQWIMTIVDFFKTALGELLDSWVGGFAKGFLGGNPFKKDDESTKVEVEITAGAGIDVDAQSAYGNQQKVTLQQEGRMFDTSASLGGLK
jgi:hypothetical protein